MDLPEKLSLNLIYAGLHWSKRKEHVDLFYYSMQKARNKIKVTEYPVIITYRFLFKKNPLDSSNCAYLVKLLEDSMVHHKILEDDDMRYVAETRMRPEMGEKDEVIIEIE